MAIEVRPLTPVIGAEVHGVDLATAPHDEAVMRRIERALYDHLVVFFRDQDLSISEQIAFAGWFGPFERHAFAKPHPDHPELVEIVQTEPKGRGTDSWHTDTSFMETPALCSVLRAVEVPAVGGDTCWASMYAAYEALSPPVQELLAGLTASHDLERPLQMTIAAGALRSDGDADAIRRQWPPTSHPVVRTHPETGRKGLYVNRNYTTRINELSAEESDAVLRLLVRHVQRPEFQVRFRWEPGSVAVWDNRCTQHYAVADYSGHRRAMRRVSVTGERPR